MQSERPLLVALLHCAVFVPSGLRGSVDGWKPLRASELPGPPMQLLPFTDIMPSCVGRVQINAHGKNARSAEQIMNLISPLVMGI